MYCETIHLTHLALTGSSCNIFYSDTWDWIHPTNFMFYLMYVHTFVNTRSFKVLDIYSDERIDHHCGQLRKYIGPGNFSSKNMRDFEEVKLRYGSLYFLHLFCYDHISGFKFFFYLVNYQLRVCEGPMFLDLKFLSNFQFGKECFILGKPKSVSSNNSFRICQNQTCPAIIWVRCSIYVEYPRRLSVFFISHLLANFFLNYFLIVLFIRPSALSNEIY